MMQELLIIILLCFIHTGFVFSLKSHKFAKVSCNSNIDHKIFRISSSIDNDNNNNMNMNQEMRSTIPSRKDMCRVFLSGIIGSEPRETYLKNGHYVVSFSLAVVGHYQAIHEWERYKPTETMWVNAEMWDQEAKSNIINLRKGSSFGGIGYMILNKWIDKNSGEEKKANKIRVLKMISPNELDQIFGPLEEVFTNQESLPDPTYDQTDNTNYQQNAYQNNQKNKKFLNKNSSEKSYMENKNSGGSKKQVYVNDNNENEDDNSNDDWSQNRDPRIPF